jgi:hypothetical protein
VNLQVSKAMELLESAGVRFRLDGERVKAVVPDPTPLDVTEALKSLAQRREEVRAVLVIRMVRPSTCVASCYQIQPGRWIHHPWDGCQTPTTPQTVYEVAQAECKHCDGAGECSCPACTLRRTEVRVPCSMCRWQARQLWLVASRPRECWHCEERRLSSQNGPCAGCEGKTVAYVQ